MAGDTSSGPVQRTAVAGWLAFLFALLTASGSLLLSLGEEKIACPLCFYQRTFVLGLAAVLGVGLLSRAAAPGRLAALALPLAVGGLGVAGFHVSLEVRGILECPSGLLNLATAPMQSLAAFVFLTVLVLLEWIAGLRHGEGNGLAGVLALGLGLGIAYASTIANPKLPEPPTKAYDGPPLTCRRPYQDTGAAQPGL